MSGAQNDLRAIDKKGALDLRTLEMDADAFASTASFDHVSTMFTKRHEFDYWFKYLDDPVDIFLLWSFSVQSIFLLMEYSSRSTYEEITRYLPNSARAVLTFSSALETLDHYRISDILTWDDQLCDRFLQKMRCGIQLAEQVFNLLYNTDYHFLEETKDNPLYFKYTEEVSSHWNSNLRKKLEPFARAQLYDPEKMDQIMKSIKHGGII